MEPAGDLAADGSNGRGLMTNRRMSSRNALSIGTLALLAGPGVAACDDSGYYEDSGYYSSDVEEAQQTQFQCAREEDGVEIAVDCALVDDDRGEVYYGGSYVPVFIYGSTYGGSTYSPGQRLPADPNRAKIGYKDSAGRTRWGLPATGRVANNTKTGVIGKGGQPVARGGNVGGGSGAKSGG